MKRFYFIAALLFLAAPAWALNITDDFGYNLTSPSFSYSELAGNGGVPISNGSWVGGSDDGYVEVALPFTFQFYGTSFNKVTIVTNGYLQFGSDSSYSSPNCPSVNTAPNDIVAGFWEDLNPGSGGTVYTATQGSLGNECFVIEFSSVAAYGGSGTVTFQFLLYQGSNNIEVRYLSTDTAGLGADAAAGLRSLFDCPNHTSLEYSCLSATISDDLDLLYAYPAVPPACGTLTFTPGSSISATPSPSATPSATPSASATWSPTPSISATVTDSFSPTPTASPSVSPTDTSSATPSASPSASPSNSPTSTISPSPSASPTDSSSPTLTASPTPSETDTSTPSVSPSPSDTASCTISPTPTATTSFTPSITDTSTPTSSPTNSPSPTASPTVTLTATASDTSTATPSATPTASESVTLTVTQTATPTATPSMTASPTITITPVPAPGTPACAVLGQNNFTSSAALALGASSLANPSGVSMDLRNVPYRIYVADTGHHRILIWNNAGSIANGQAADGVIGQANFSGASANRGGSVAGNTLSSPEGISVDLSTGDLWVADSGNHRVLRFSAPVPLTGATASYVLGQGGSFTNATANFGGISSQSLQSPSDLNIDGNQNLAVADTGNNRALRFDISTPSTTANTVWGQSDFSSNLPNGGGSTGSATLSSPMGIFLSASTLWVSDTGNNRVLGFPLFPPGSAASQVLGQVNFSNNQGNQGFPLCSSITLKSPLGLGMDGAGRLFVADSGNDRVIAFSAPYSSGAGLAYGQSGLGSNTPGCGNNLMSGPAASFASATGNLLVSDTVNNRLLFYGCSGGFVGPATFTPTVTESITPTPTHTVTPSVTPSSTISDTSTPSPTATISATFTVSPTQSLTLTISCTSTPTPSVSPSSTVTRTFTRTPSPSITPTRVLPHTLTPYPHPPAKAISYPNPVGPSDSQVCVAFPPGTQAQLQVYDLLLDEVRNLDSQSIQAGRGVACWDLRNNSGARIVAGIYYIRVLVDGTMYMTKMTVY